MGQANGIPQMNETEISYQNGPLVNNLPQGLGEKKILDEGLYQGFFNEGKRHGKGRIFYNNDEYYQGRWKNDQINGKGIYIYKDFSRYKGEFLNGNKHGHGKLIFPNMDFYDGQFFNDQFHGKGIRYYRGKNQIFEQSYVNGKLQKECLNVKRTEEFLQIEKLNSLPIKKKQSFEEKKSGNGTPVQENQNNEIDLDEEQEKSLMQVVFDTQKIQNAGPQTMSLIHFNQKLEDVNKNLLKKGVQNWDEKEVAGIVREVGLAQHANTFEENRIDGRSILLLKQKDFVDLGVTKIGEQIVLRELIKKLKYQKSLQNQKRKKQLEIEQNQHTIAKNIKQFCIQAIQEEDYSSSLNTNSFSNSISSDEKVNKSQKLTNLAKRKTSSIQNVNVYSPQVTKDKKNKTVKCEDDKNLFDQDVGEALENLSMKANIDDGEISSVTQSSTSNDSDNSYNTKNKLDYMEDISENLRNFVIKKTDLKLKCKIGEGGVGVVYNGSYLGADVAIKIFTSSKIKIAKKFLQEAEILCSFRSPYIVLFMGVCLNYQHYMIITELMKTSLHDLLHIQKKVLNINEKIQILENIANGVNYLHKKKYLHCDLKSSNILIGENYSDVKICDFGLSKMKTKLKKNNNMVIGTANWMPPETLRGEKYTEESDVYSFGVVIWELLCEQIPFADHSSQQIIGMIGYDESEQPKLNLNKDNCVNKRLKRLMKKCLQRQPENRPDFDLIVQELKNINETISKDQQILSFNKTI